MSLHHALAPNRENKRGVVEAFVVSRRSGLGTSAIARLFLRACSLLGVFFASRLHFATLDFDASTLQRSINLSCCSLLQRFRQSLLQDLHLQVTQSPKRMTGGKDSSKAPLDTAKDAQVQMQALHHTHRKATR